MSEDSREVRGADATPDTFERWVILRNIQFPNPNREGHRTIYREAKADARARDGAE
jgi:hypothetical protein